MNEVEVEAGNGYIFLTVDNWEEHSSVSMDFNQAVDLYEKLGNLLIEMS